MMKRLFILSLLVLGVGTGCSMLEPKETYTSEPMGLSFQYPSNWKVHEDDGGIFLSNPEEVFVGVFIFNGVAADGWIEEDWDGGESAALNNVLETFNISMNDHPPSLIEIIEVQNNIEVSSFPAAQAEFVVSYPMAAWVPQELQQVIEDNEDAYEGSSDFLVVSRITIIDLGDKPLSIIEQRPHIGSSSKSGQEMEKIVGSLSFTLSTERGE